MLINSTSDTESVSRIKHLRLQCYIKRKALHMQILQNQWLLESFRNGRIGITFERNKSSTLVAYFKK
jgi:hypothetical protein